MRLTTESLAAKAGCSHTHIYKAVKQGLLEPVKVRLQYGFRFEFPVDAISTIQFLQDQAEIDEAGWHSMTQATRIAQCHERTLYKAIQRGLLPAKKVRWRGRWRHMVKDVDLRNYMAVHRRKKRAAYAPRWNQGSGKEIVRKLSAPLPPERHPDCASYSRCLDKAAKENSGLACAKCPNYRISAAWGRCG